MLAAWIEDLFAEAPVGAGWGPRRTLAHRGPRRPTLAGFVPICARHTLVDLTPKYPTLRSLVPPGGNDGFVFVTLRLYIPIYVHRVPCTPNHPAASPYFSLLRRSPRPPSCVLRARVSKTLFKTCSPRGGRSRGKLPCVYKTKHCTPLNIYKQTVLCNTAF